MASIFITARASTNLSAEKLQWLHYSYNVYGDFKEPMTENREKYGIRRHIIDNCRSGVSRFKVVDGVLLSEIQYYMNWTFNKEEITQEDLRALVLFTQDEWENGLGKLHSVRELFYEDGQSITANAYVPDQIPYVNVRD